MDSQNNSSATIGRTFTDIPEKTAEGSEQASLYKPPGFGWDELLKYPRVLIVSEAGAGKTFECRQQQKTLWATDEAAFYVELSELASNNLPDLLRSEENSRFRRWLDSQADVATFFLDSIDELKLTRGSFETALKRLNNAVARNMDRVRVVITTRPTPFDRHIIQQYLPIPPKPAATPSVEDFADEVMHRKKAVRQWVLPPDWRYVSLEPLSKHQIQAIASENGVTDTDKLLDHIYRNHLDEFVQRPQDLIELCVDWQPSGLMRDHRAQIENNIHIKLKSRTDRNEAAQLPDAKALEGASRLALAAVLTRKLTIRHSAEADKEGEAGTALSPETILSDWTPDERKALLERALFDFATYGRVRFHHRSVIEYLAARQLEKMLERGASIKAIKRLLFAETSYGIKIVKPTMQPVAAWLAAGNTSLFDEVLSREPDVLLNFGGPQSLSLEQRRRALREYVARFGEGARRDLHVPRVQVRRFASPELVPEALRLLNTQIQNPEVRELLMELIASAPTKDAAEFAHALVIRGDASLGERLYALDVLIALNDPQLDAVRKAMLDDVAAWTNEITGRAILRLFPAHAPIDWLRSILPRTTEEPRSVGILNWYWPQAIADAQLGSADLDVLREVLTDIVRKDIAHHKDSDKIATPMQHLVSPLAATCACLLQGRGVASDKVIESSVTALRVAMDNHVPDEQVNGLNRLLAKGDASIRERTFWAIDELNQQYNSVSDPWSRLHKVLDQNVVNLNPGDDEAWILKNISDRERNIEEHKLMIAAAINLPGQKSTEQREYVTALKKHVSDSPELVAFIGEHLKPPPPNPEYERMQATQQQRKREEQQKDDDARASWNEFRDEVKNNPTEAFGPDKVENTIWNLWQAMRNAGAGNRSNGWSRQFIEQHFGKDIADKLRSALMQFWRTKSPTLRSERTDNKKSDLYLDDQLGLAAIEAESEDGAWSSKLSPDEAKLAARYVPNVLNGFPVWIGKLVATHPLDVESILGPELIAELNEQSATSSFSMLLQNVHYANKEVTAIFIPRLVAWLTENASRMRNGEEISATVDRLQKVGDVLSRHGDAKMHAQLKVIALQQLERGADPAFARAWIPLLMQMDPATGTRWLEKVLRDVEPSQNGAGVDWIVHLFYDPHSTKIINLYNPKFIPALLLKLVRLAYRFVRLADDIPHEGAYTPDKRDHAQEARNALLSVLLATNGADGWAAKCELANDPHFEHFRDRAMLIAQKKAADEADCATITEAEIAALNRNEELSPHTRGDMHRLLVDRLDDLDDLLAQDESPRELWATIAQERLMRRAIAGVLRYAAHGAYKVDQESVTANEHETDIRLRATASEQEAVIELKLGKNHSGRDLRDTIKNQLVKKYMAPETRRTGCLMVTVASDGRWQHPDSNEKLDAAGLRHMLETEAKKVEQDMAFGVRLVVRILDLRQHPQNPVSAATLD